MRKRIFAFFMATFLLLASLCFSVFGMLVSLESEVMSDLSSLKIDGVLFNEADYPCNPEDANMYIVATAEVGFVSTESSPDFAFYLYVYNPSCQRIFTSLQSSVKVGFGYNCNDYSLYRVKLLSHSDDWRFLKYRVVDSDSWYVSDFYTKQNMTAEAPERVYNIVGVYQWVNGDMQEVSAVSPTFADKDIGRCYLYRGSDSDGTLTCCTKKIETIDLDLRYTYWRSPTSDLGQNIHYQINTLYFALDREYVENFHHIYNIKGNCMKYWSSDIIVTNSEKINTNTQTGVDRWAATIEAMTNGTVLDGYNNNLMSLFDPIAYNLNDSSLLPLIYKNFWFYNIPSKFDKVIEMWGFQPERVNCIAYYFYRNFETPDSEEWTFDAVSSNEFKEYIWNFSKNKPQKDGSFAGDGIVNDKLYLRKEPFDFDVNYKDLISFDGYSATIPGGFAGWLERLFLGKDSVYVKYQGEKDVKPIVILKDEALQDAVTSKDDSILPAFCDEMMIAQKDYSDFREFCEIAERNNQAVVLLRFDVDSYLCQKLGEEDYSDDLYEGSIGDQNIWRIRMPFYTDLNVWEMTFAEDDQDEVLFTVAVSNDPIDGYPGIDIHGGASDPFERFKDLFDESKTFWEKFLAVLKIILIVLVAIFVIWLFIKFIVPLLSPVIGAVATVVTAPFKAISKRRGEKQKKKNSKKKKE